MLKTAPELVYPSRHKTPEKHKKHNKTHTHHEGHKRIQTTTVLDDELGAVGAMLGVKDGDALGAFEGMMDGA